MELIAAVDREWAIGREGRLLFSIPEDLARFKALTRGHAVVYGRKTLDTFPGGRPLPERRNYLLSRQADLAVPGAVCVPSVSALLEWTRDEKALFVAGGESVYRALLPFCDRAWVTRIEAAGGGDRYCPNLEEAPDWALAEASEWKHWNGLRYRFCLYQRTEKGKEGA